MALHLPESSIQRVLVLDDHPDWADALGLVLAAHGNLAVESFSEPRAALRRLVRAPRPHVVVVDYMMPGMDGGAFCRAAARLDEALSFVLVTAAEEIDPDTRALCSAVVRKPVCIEDFVAIVRGAPGNRPTKTTLQPA